MALTSKIGSTKSELETCIQEKQTAEENFSGYKKSMIDDVMARNKYITELKQSNETLMASLNANEENIRSLTINLEDSVAREQMLEIKICNMVSEKTNSEEIAAVEHNKMETDLIAEFVKNFKGTNRLS